MKPAKKISRDTFEKVKEEAKKATREVSPAKFTEEAAKQTGLKPSKEETQEQPETLTNSKRKAEASQRIKELEEEIRLIQKQREREEAEGREVKKDVEAGRKVVQLKEKKKEEEPPAITQARRKAGTKEIRIKGPSG